MFRLITSGKIVVVLACLGACATWAQSTTNSTVRPRISTGLPTLSSAPNLADALQPFASPTDPAINKVRIAQIESTDVVTTNQLNRAYAGTAMGLAVAGAQMPALGPGERGVGAGVGYYEGSAALGFLVKTISSTGNGSWQAGASTDGKRFGLSVGMGWKWE